MRLRSSAAMIGAPGGDREFVEVNPEGRDKLAVANSAEEGAVADTDGMAQGSFGAAKELDAMMVESGGLQGEAEGNIVQAQTIPADQTVESSDFATPPHAEPELSEDGQRARLHLPPADSQDGFRVSDLVWAQLEGHPWWPAEIFDPSDASELALKHQKEGNHLVAFFGDSSFAWCDESQLMPFMANYSQMEKQGNYDAFTIAVNHALQELSRRILAATSCSCLEFSGMSHMVENSGLKAGVTCSTVNKAEMLKHFSPESLLRYAKSLALSPGQGGDLQDLVIACSQLMPFYQSKGCRESASFQSSSGWGENGIDSLSTKNVMLVEPDAKEVQPNHVKPKRGKGRPRKRKPDDNLELMEKEPMVKPHNEKPVKRRRVKRHTEDLLGNLCPTAETPMNGCSLSGTVKVETTDHMQDAYWSGLSLHNTPIYSFKGASGKTRPVRKRRPTWRVCAPASDLSSPAQNMHSGTLDHNRRIQVIKRSIIHVDEKIVHEVNPTALVLSFGRSSDLPSEMDLIRMFSRSGALKETETEVHRSTNTVKVVFKKRIDAERAFSVAGSFGSFGPSLCSFRLVNMPFSLTTTEMNNPKLCPEDSGLKIPAHTVSGVSPDSAQVDIIDKADKGEAVKKTTVERAEIVKQAGQDEDVSRNKESADLLSDAMQTETIDDSPKHNPVIVDGVDEASEDTMEVDNTDAAQAQTSIPRGLRAQAFTGCVAKQSVEDEYVFQGIEGPKVEVPVGDTRNGAAVELKIAG